MVYITVSVLQVVTKAVTDIITVVCDVCSRHEAVEDSHIHSRRPVRDCVLRERRDEREGGTREVESGGPTRVCGLPTPPPPLKGKQSFVIYRLVPLPVLIHMDNNLWWFKLATFHHTG